MQDLIKKYETLTTLEERLRNNDYVKMYFQTLKELEEVESKLSSLNNNSKVKKMVKGPKK